jgi:thiamine-monophosphate kinase
MRVDATPLPAWPHPSDATVGDIGERAIIAWIASAVPSPSSAGITVGIGDDCAVVEPTRNRVEVHTIDMQVEDVHFRWAFSTPEQVGARALHVNLSDLAAMGAEPRHALVSLGLPASMPGTQLHGVLTGLFTAAHHAGVAVIGGNISRAPVLVIDITMVGTAKRRRYLTRAGARPGDAVYVSGTVGAAAAALAWLQADPAWVSSGRVGEPSLPARPPSEEVGAAIRRFVAPDARVALGIQVARNRAASACMDTSDGLADALHQIAAGAGVGIELEQAAIPLDPAVLTVSGALSLDPWTLALSGGEDYELVFTVPKRATRRFGHATGRAGLPPVTRIGVCVREPGVRVVDVSGVARPVGDGFDHFSGVGSPHS